MNFRENLLYHLLTTDHCPSFSETVISACYDSMSYRVSKKKYPLLAGNRNETIRYYYSPSRQISLLVSNLDLHTLHSKIVHQTQEIQACKVKFYSAPETRGLEKGSSHDLYHAYFPKHL